MQLQRVEMEYLNQKWSMPQSALTMNCGVPTVVRLLDKGPINLL